MTEGYNIAIVGSGPGGLSAAGRAAALDRISGKTEPSYILLEALVNVGGHLAGSEFELVSWSQGEGHYSEKY